MFNDITGQKFGRLEATSRAFKDQQRRCWHWICVCECGAELIVRGDCLMSGNTRSCGCLRRDRIVESHFVHGKSKDPLYDVWIAMRARCLDPNNGFYHNYGGRGIALCEEWLNYIPFQEWSLKNGYKRGLCIDRRNNNGPYSPENCRWVTHKTNNRNTRRTHYITYAGETKSLTDWAEEKGLNAQALGNRLNNYNWSIERALETPIGYRSPRKVA